MERNERKCNDITLILTFISLSTSTVCATSFLIDKQKSSANSFGSVTSQDQLTTAFQGIGSNGLQRDQLGFVTAPASTQYGQSNRISTLADDVETKTVSIPVLRKTYSSPFSLCTGNDSRSDTNPDGHKECATGTENRTVPTSSALQSTNYFNGHLKLSKSATEYRVNVRECMDNQYFVSGSEGTVWGLDNQNSSDFNNARILKMCRFAIVAPKGRHLIMTMEVLGSQGPCTSGTTILAMVQNNFGLVTMFKLSCERRFSRSPVLFIPSNVVDIKMINNSWEFTTDLEKYKMPTVLPKFKIVFISTSDALWTKLFPVFTSDKTGFIASPGFDLSRPHSPFLDAFYNLTVPENHAVMISFPHFDLMEYYSHFLKLSFVKHDGTLLSQTKHTTDNYIPPDIYHTVATLVLELRSEWYGSYLEHPSGMNMSFSFYTELDAPRKLSNGLFDCSEPAVYARFQHHVHCNLQRECQGGEDEGPHCPFSSPACNGSIDAGKMCFLPVESRTALTWDTARERCRAKGGDLAMMRTPLEYEALWDVFKYGRKFECAYVGLQLRQRNSHPLYGRTWAWADGTTAFGVNVTSGVFSETWPSLVVMATDRMLLALDATSPRCSRYICQVQSQAHSQDTGPLHLPALSNIPSANSTLRFKGTKLVRCSAGHFTHNFLRCYSGSQCGAQAKQASCSLSLAAVSTERSTGFTPSESVAMFMCDNNRQSVPYTVVCDFMSDCPDDSDETLCKHEVCSAKYQCRNGQCVPRSRLCDLYVDCLDGSDENNCVLSLFQRNAYDFIYQYKLPPPTVINYDNEGFYKQTPLTPDEPCPEISFKCSGGQGTFHCLPAYLLCNGVKDCASGEDELGCDSYTCPGFYRCRDSSVCVHVDQVCDGVTQCPKQDDELLCDATCPPQCVCQGLAFICHQPFPAHSFPSLRYLDASHSGMNLADLASNWYLVYLNLESCDLNNIQDITLPNLRHLDLSQNELSSIDVDMFLAFQNLQTLTLKGNPLTSLTGGTSDKRQFRLERLDVSYSRLPLLSGTPFQRLFSLQAINVSFSRVTALADSFQSIPTLAEVDLRGNPVSSYPQDVFKAMINLRVIYVDNYKLCCPGMLPEGFEKEFCFAPEDEISSCADLLRADSYRAFLWFICVASIVGNVGSFLSRNWFHKSRSASGFNTFVSNLSMADCLMGVYLAFIGVADLVYRGSYYQYEQDWTSSVPCSIAGFLSLLSNEVSAITICLITLDRFIVLRFPFSRWKFHRRSAGVACALTWFWGIVLGVTPLLVPHWQFYGQTGICVPLPVTRQEFEGQGYSFGVMIVFNFLLFMLIAGGQVSIYLSVQANSMTVDSNRKLQDMTIARRLITVAVSDFLCWFPIGLLGLLASGGVPVPGEVNVALAIFVLPLNSALNPFLYTFNMMAEKRRKRQEKRLLEWLEKNGDEPLAASTAGTSVSRSVEKSEAEACQASGGRDDDVHWYLSTALQFQLVVCDEVRSFLSTLRASAD